LAEPAGIGSGIVQRVSNGGEVEMFFYLSKIVWFCLQPSSLLLILLVVGAGLLFTRFKRAGRRLVVIAAVLLVVGGLLPLSTWLILPLEERFSRAELSGRDVDGIVVLGGAEDSTVTTSRNVHGINEAGERFTETAALARRFPTARIVFTSGSVEILTTPTIGADAGGLVLEDLGISGRDRLILERRSRNTWENAVFTKVLVDPKPGERWLLVTSAAHMPRAMGVFRQAGFPVEPWPVDYRTAGPWDLVRIFDKPSEGLRRLDQASREWVGLVAYWLTGRSDALFPGPR
jgi:uncharacterized SAM-binding protein YcdF (DUF218 family)